MNAKCVKMTEKEFIEYSNMEFYILDLKAENERLEKLARLFAIDKHKHNMILAENERLKKAVEEAMKVIEEYVAQEGATFGAESYLKEYGGKE